MTVAWPWRVVSSPPGAAADTRGRRAGRTTGRCGRGTVEGQGTAPAGQLMAEVEPRAGRSLCSGRPAGKLGCGLASRRRRRDRGSPQAEWAPGPAGGGPAGSLPSPSAVPGSPSARSHLLCPRHSRRCQARRVLARLRRLRRELRAEPSLLPVLPPPAPGAPRGSAGCLRRPLRWEEEAAPRATGVGSKANNSSEHWAPFGGQHTCPTSRVSGNALPSLGPPRYPLIPPFPPLSPPSPLPASQALPPPSAALFPSPFPSPLSPPGRPWVPRTDSAFPPCPAGGPPGESAVDWCLYQLNGAAEFEVSEGEYGGAEVGCVPSATALAGGVWRKVAHRWESGRRITWQPPRAWGLWGDEDGAWA